MLAHPEVSDRSCDDCERFMYEDGVNRMGRRPLPLADGRPMPRPKGAPTPCHQCPKVPADAPARTRAHAVEPSERSLRALWHYRKCSAVGRFPEDPIVERNAAIIKTVEGWVNEAKAAERTGVLGDILAKALG